MFESYSKKSTLVVFSRSTTSRRPAAISEITNTFRWQHAILFSYVVASLFCKNPLFLKVYAVDMFYRSTLVSELSNMRLNSHLIYQIAYFGTFPSVQQLWLAEAIDKLVKSNNWIHSILMSVKIDCINQQNVFIKSNCFTFEFISWLFISHD